jgi:hypothetical protein
MVRGGGGRRRWTSQVRGLGETMIRDNGPVVLKDIDSSLAQGEIGH